MPALAPILLGFAFTVAAAYSLGCAAMRRLLVPRTVAFAVGSGLLSFIVFFLMLPGAANRWTFAAVGAACIFLVGQDGILRGGCQPPQWRTRNYVLVLALASYAVLYTVNALAPEIQPDAGTYHLGLVAESLRLGGFPPRVAFYEMLPQGMEMLFAFAFAFGAHSAAKLVHFAFLVATFPLMLALGRKLEIPAGVSATAAALYVVTPVVGIAGTSAYTDAALVFFILATLYLLLLAREEPKPRLLLAAGITAGFCYAVKTTGLMIAPLAVLFVAADWPLSSALRKRREVLLVAAGAALMIAPWMLRDAVLAGNPLAPLFNAVFPNPHFHISTERQLSQSLRSYGGLGMAQAPRELAFGGGLHGLIGPVFLLLPLGLIALRRRAGRFAWAAALVLAVPWVLNIGARFLMPSLPFLFYALALSLPRAALAGVLLLHAAACWPASLALYTRPNAWCLRGFPWRAALRVEPEDAYLKRVYPEYSLARLLDAKVPPGKRVLDLLGIARAYSRTDTLVYWHAAEGDRAHDALLLGVYSAVRPLSNLEARWAEAPLRAVRFRLAAAAPAGWTVHEARLYRGLDRALPNRQWSLGAGPNLWETPLAFDGNAVSRWTTWGPGRPGAYLLVEFGRPLRLDRAVLVGARSEAVRVEVEGQDISGRWRLLDRNPVRSVHPVEDLPRQATRFLKREGFDYVLAPAGQGGNGPIGSAMLKDPQAWAVEEVAVLGDIHLFRID